MPELGKFRVLRSDDTHVFVGIEGMKEEFIRVPKTWDNYLQWMLGQEFEIKPVEFKSLMTGKVSRIPFDYEALMKKFAGTGETFE